MPIIMVTGGARSGKSAYAEQRCKDMGGDVTYIACAAITDDDMARRVALHRAQRPAEWQTLEQYRDFNGAAETYHSRVFLLDCITTMITNIMLDEPVDYDTCGTEEIARVEAGILKQIDGLIGQFKDSDKTLVAVTNEVGQGIVPAYRLGSIFRDIAGRMNQYIAAQADEVICMISGLPLKLK